jgi:hypothetical protein
MRTIIAGSRFFDCDAQDHIWPSMACTKCRKRIDLIDAVVRRSGIEVTFVISGDCRGPDRQGVMWASLNKIPYATRRPDWATYGRRVAGKRRNTEMITKDGAEALIAIWDGESRGTADLIVKATKAGLVVHIYNLIEEREKRAKRVSRRKTEDARV